MGLFTLEQCVYLEGNQYTPRGQPFTTGPGTYKIPSSSDIPIQLNVSLMDRTPNPKAIFSSKVINLIRYHKMLSLAWPDSLHVPSVHILFVHQQYIHYTTLIYIVYFYHAFACQRLIQIWPIEPTIQHNYAVFAPIGSWRASSFPCSLCILCY